MANTKAKHDPLEAAKVTTERMEADDETAARKDWQPSTAPPRDDSPPAATAPPPPPPKPVRRKVTHYEVLHTRQVNVGRGQMHTFRAGSRVDPSGYTGGIERLKKLGLEFKAIEVEVEG